MEILARQDLKQRINDTPKFYNAVIIGVTEFELLGLSSFCKESMTSLFADILDPSREDSPTLEKIKQCVGWAVDKEDLIISCAAGVSRSSSIAYLTECMKSKDPEASINILDVKKHRPNQLILCYGNIFLGQDVVSPIFEYYKFALEQNPNDTGLKFYLKDLLTLKKKML